MPSAEARTYRNERGLRTKANLTYKSRGLATWEEKKIHLLESSFINVEQSNNQNKQSKYVRRGGLSESSRKYRMMKKENTSRRERSYAVGKVNE